MLLHRPELNGVLGVPLRGVLTVPVPLCIFFLAYTAQRFSGSVFCWLQ